MKKNPEVKRFLLDGYQTRRMGFRLFREEDLEDWLAFYQDPESTAYWEGIPEIPEDACKQQFNRIFERYEKGLGGMNALTDLKTGKLLGMCGLLVQEVDGREELEIGYSLLPDSRGKGFATEAGLICRDQAFKNDWANSLISIIHVENEPSKQVARRLGMKPEQETTYKGISVRIFRVYP